MQRCLGRDLSLAGGLIVERNGLTAPQLHHALEAAGLERGDSVHGHSSLRSIGWTKHGARGVIQATCTMARRALAC